MSKSRNCDSGFCLAAMIAGAIACAAALAVLVNRWPSHKALFGLSDEARHALYQRIFDTLNRVCPGATGDELRQYCQDQARFIAQFPECGEPCQVLCREFLLHPTK
jgi:hypothetical protein